MSRMMVMAGGTGGHVMPALAVARCLRDRGVEVRWMGNADGLEARLVPADGFELDSIRIRGVRRSGLLRKLTLPFMLTTACFQAMRILRRRKPDVLLGMGGFVSGPGGLVAAAMGKPLVLHEQNAVAGMTNRWLGKVAKRALSGFPRADGLSNPTWVGNPVRQDIAAIPSPSERLPGREGPLRILVVGGSQGAQVFNRHLPRLLAESGRTSLDIHHQCGKGNAADVAAAYAESGLTVRVDEFIDDMASAYAWSDLVICRAGAMTVAEVCAAGAVALFVPYPYAVSDHQARNAEYLSAAEGAFCFRQEAFVNGDWLASLRDLAADRSRLLTMAETARSLAKTDATERVADICEELANA